jgi:hypothetical protein
MREDDVEREGLPSDEPNSEEALPVSEPDSAAAEGDIERSDRERREGEEPGEPLTGSPDPDYSGGISTRSE